MKIGVMGGTFNPVHLGHLILAQFAKQNLKLDRVLFLPNGAPPHKLDCIISDSVRLKMLEIATENNTDFEICRSEISKDGLNYSVDTFVELRKKFFDDILYFIMGSDAFLQIKLWHDYQRLLSICSIAVAVRAGDDLRVVRQFAAGLKKIVRSNIEFFFSPLIEISSSDLRERIKNCEPISYLVPDKVERYIIENKLYL